MYLHALATASPTAVFTQMQCRELAKTEAVRKRLNRRSQLILHSILSGDSGVMRRHFAVADIARIFDASADELNEAFRGEAPKLAGAALAQALAEAGVRTDEVDALFICTCTGYLCPGVTSYVAEKLGLREDAVLHDLAGLGCGAAIPTLRAAHAFLAANPGGKVATVAVEICSAAFFLDDDPGVLISACLFGDGAAAAIWTNTPGPGGLRVSNFSSLHRPKHRDEIRFEQREGKLRNLLAATVPALAADATAHLLAGELRREGARAIARIAAHPGGRDVIEALGARLPGYDFSASRRVLAAHGNMSSASVLFVLQAMLRDGGSPTADADWWLVSFGAGFSAHGCRFGY
jgi:alkylresorcinol/alkylpyrone synthase